MSKNKHRSRNKGSGIRVHFLGAARSVTGSFHFFEVRNGRNVTRFFVDCGMLQEDESLNFQNRLPEHLSPKDVDFGIFSHAHIDHIGYFPRLVKDGFRGVAYATKATKDLMGLLLPDSGFIQEERSRAAARDPANKNKDTKPLYTQRDAREAVNLVREMEFGSKFEPAPDISVEFRPSSHLLGAAVVVLKIGRGRAKRTIAFSGDIGRKGMPCLKDIAPVTHADFVLCESTYGNRLHPKRDRLAALADSINRAYGRATVSHKHYGPGKIIIPVFAVGRAQAVLYDLRLLMQQKRIRNIPVFIDSPMAIKATEVYRKNRDIFPNGDAKRARKADLFRTPKFEESRSKEQSTRLDQRFNQPIIILSSSGMANGGRVLEHLKHRLPGPQNSVIFVGHQSEGTNGALLTAGEAKTLEIDGETVAVRASVELLEDYSGHGDWEDIMAWLKQFQRRPTKAFLVHGDEESATALKARMEETLMWNVEIPERGQFVDLP